MENVSTGNWRLRPFVNEDNMTYVVWNEMTHEGLIVDPSIDDLDRLIPLIDSLVTIKWIAVIDTHTHADHISCATELAAHVRAPVVMGSLAPSKRVHVRVSLDTELQSQAGPIEFLMTPGHSPDSISVIWGPYLFTGDTILYGDTGRDDLPGGHPADHFESLLKIKKAAKSELVFLPGHDSRGGRDSTWGEQLKINPSLSQSREEFVREATAFKAAAPKNLKESLFENMK